MISHDISDSKGSGGGAFLLKKCGAGTLQLTGANSYTGQTILEGGTLSVASFDSVAKGKPGSSLGPKTEVAITKGATLALNFKGEMRVAKLIIDGKPQPAGSFNTANLPEFIKGTGVLRIE